MSEALRLTWHQGRRIMESGVAGDVPLFTISYRSQRDHPAWQMRTDLPLLTGKSWEDDDRDALKAEAERVLAGWLARIGASAGESR